MWRFLPECLGADGCGDIVRSLEKTRHLLIAHESMKRRGVYGEILFRLVEAEPNLMKNLKAPIKRVGQPNVALPHGTNLELAIAPQVKEVFAGVKEVCA